MQRLYTVELCGIPSDGGENLIKGFSFQQTQLLQGMDAHSRMGKRADGFTHLAGIESIRDRKLLRFNYCTFKVQCI